MRQALFACVAWSMAAVAAVADTTPYDLPNDGDQTEYGRKATVYYNQKVYTFSRYSSGAWSAGAKGDYIGCAQYSNTSADGRLSDFKRMAWVANPANGGDDAKLSGQDVAATVYKGRAFVFYDFINPANWSERLIYYKSSTDPENSWEPKGGTRVSVAAPVNTGFGLYASMLTLTAAVLNDKLYVFYTHINWDRVCSVVYDGKTWAVGPTLSDWRFKCLDAKSVLTDTRKGVIAIAGVGNYFCYVVTFDGTNYYPSTNYVDFYGLGVGTDYMRAAYGSVEGGTQRNVLQVFGSSGAPCRFDYTLPGDTAQGGAFSAKSPSAFDRATIGWCPVVNYLSDNNKNLQQYVTLVGTEVIHFPNYTEYIPEGSTYVSDYFKFLAENEIDTAGAGYLPSAWSVIGVIEGVPPFTWNNNTPDPLGSCNVKYGQSSERTVSTTSTFDASFTVGLEAKVEGIFSGGFSFTQGFKNVQDYSKTITSSINLTWANKDKNVDGSKGFLLISKPTLVVRNYTQYASDGASKFADVNFTSVTDVNLEYEEYNLASPPAGMKIRPKSSDYRGWYRNSPANVNIYQKMNSLTASTGGGSSESSISVTTANSVERGSTSAVKVEVGLFDIFKTSSKFKFDLTSKNSTTLGQNISATLALPAAPAGQATLLNRLSVAPYWLMPNDKSQAYWIPSDYQWNEPWCLTWSVLSLDPAPVNVAATSLDFNADGVQDVLAFTPASGQAAKGAGVLAGSVYMTSDGKTLDEYNLLVPDSQHSLVGAGEFTANGQTGLVWFDSRYGQLSLSLTQDSIVGQAHALQGVALDSADYFADCGDFLGLDGCDELLLRDPASGMLVVWGVDTVGYTISSVDMVFNPGSAAWLYLTKGDFDGNGCWDLLVWNKTTGAFKIVYLKERGEDGSVVKAVETVFATLAAGKAVYSGARLAPVGVGDFNGDAVSDVLFRDADSGRMLVALMAADGLKASGYIRGFPKLSGRQQVAGIGDFDHDGRADLLLAVPSPNSERAPKLRVKYLGAKDGSDAAPLKVLRKGRLALGKSFEEELGVELFESLD